ncbi:hypothetical protein SB775_31225, partial [Peribacillus sp. SIMBA_075]|uniref:hypothetical protein n=1 Tax=Peribacillus sp. SIMBA_075 TaxID=3085813 RepID=UPI00397A932E
TRTARIHPAMNAAMAKAPTNTAALTFVVSFWGTMPCNHSTIGSRNITTSTAPRSGQAMLSTLMKGFVASNNRTHQVPIMLS